MDDKIVKVIFKEGWETMYNNDLTQSDYGLALQIEGITLADGNVEVHFSLTEHNGEAPISIGTVKDNVITVDIPDFILQKKDVYTDSYQAYAWIYVTDGESGRTIRKIVFTIDTRAEPSTNVPEDQKDKFLHEVRQVMAETKEVAQSVRDDADNGKFSGIPGPPGKDGKNGEDGKDGDDGEDGKSAYQYAVEGGFEGTEQEFIDLMAQAGHVDLTGYVTKEQHEAELLKAFVKVTTDKSPFHHITDSANMKVVEFGVKGITEQETVGGNQLFDISKFVSIGSVTNNGDGSITISSYSNNVTSNKISECCPNITVGQTIIASIVGGTNKIYFGGTVMVTNKSYTVTQEMLDNDKFGFYGVSSTETTSDNPVTISDIMINEGTTVLPCEKYVGGMPSPNPEHKEEIELAGVYNEETGRYEHKCCVGNKNSFDLVKAQDESNYIWGSLYPYFPIYVGQGNTITFSCNLSNATGFTRTVTIFDAVDGSLLSYIWHNENTGLQKEKVTITSTNDYIYIRLGCLKTETLLWLDYISNIQIEYDSVKTTYTPHASQPFTLTSDRPLTKWDKLVKRDGVWGWSVWSKEIEISNDMTFTPVAGDDGMRFTTPVSDIETHEVMCTIFKGVRKSWTDLSINEFTYHSGSFRFYVSADIATNKDEWGVWLGQNPFKVQAKALTEQAFIPLPDEEQTILNNLETYYGVTNVYNEQGCPMWLTYVADTKLYVDNKLLQIQQAMI